MSKKWLALGVLGLAIVAVAIGFFSGKPDNSRDEFNVPPSTKSDPVPPPAGTTRETTLPR